jgi:hypothetical protein
MPALKFWGHDTNVAADDLPVPAAICAAFQATLALLAAVVLGGISDRHHLGWAGNFVCLTLAVCLVSVAVEISICVYARLGASPVLDLLPRYPRCQCPNYERIAREAACHVYV